MSISSEHKRQLILDFGANSSDTGSSEVQVAIFSWRIANLTNHFASHAGDNHSRRGLRCLISKRRSLLNDLKRKDFDRYSTLVTRLKLRH